MSHVMKETMEAVTTIAEEGGVEAAAMVVGLMEINHRHLEKTFESLYEAEKADHERTKARLRAAYEELDLIEHRMQFMLGRVHTIFPVYEQ